MSDLYQVFDDAQQRKVENFAALDIGSNSFHLVIARLVADAVQIVHRVKHKVRLADGLDANNMLSDDAIQRGIDTLESMSEAISGLDASAIRIVATHTLRRARNAHVFLRKASEVFSYPIEIISGNEEARLIFVGVSSSIATQTERLVFDIGGGSTEFAIGKDMQPNICKSLQMGCVSYQKRFFSDNSLSPANTRRAIISAKLELELAAGNLRKHKWQTSIASSGTARAICSIINLAKENASDSEVDLEDLYTLLERCHECNTLDELKLNGLSEDRRQVLVPGLCIVIAIVESLNIVSFHFSESALREGVLYELQPSHSSQNIRIRTAQSLATRYDVDVNYAHKVLSSCMYIFDRVRTEWQINEPTFRHILGWAALLHELGLQINSRGIQKHSSYVILNSEMPGFNQDQQNAIAFLVRYHRKKIKIDDTPPQNVGSKRQMYALLCILRLGIMLNINRHQPALPQFEILCASNDIKLGFAQDWFELSPMLLADITRENQYLKPLKIHLSLL